jgi:hypothetical protein
VSFGLKNGEKLQGIGNLNSSNCTLFDVTSEILQMVTYTGESGYLQALTFRTSNGEHIDFGEKPTDSVAGFTEMELQIVGLYGSHD